MIKTFLLSFSIAATTMAAPIQADMPDPKETQALAEGAYIYALPFIVGYKTVYALSVDSNGSNSRDTFNQIKNTDWVYGPREEFLNKNRGVPAV